MLEKKYITISQRKYWSSKIDPDEVWRMASIGCTHEEIAQKFKVNRQIIDLGYATEFEAGRVIFKEQLREAQFNKAMNGDSQMLIWLGKIHLNQREVAFEERISELDMLIKHLDLKAECLNLVKSSSEVINKQQLASTSG